MIVCLNSLENHDATPLSTLLATQRGISEPVRHKQRVRNAPPVHSIRWRLRFFCIRGAVMTSRFINGASPSTAPHARELRPLSVEVGCG